MKTLRMVLIILAAVIVAILFIRWNFSSPEIEISIEHNSCQTDDDCTYITLDCGDCKPVPINNEYLGFYHDQKNCNGYRGAMCDMFICPVACINNRCAFDCPVA
ncbi:MAG: hypothetical protein GXP63_02920 [DPANN group archaeon]|nr:hypothetical protein [DPANN group archaeon]